MRNNEKPQRSSNSTGRQNGTGQKAADTRRIMEQAEANFGKTNLLFTGSIEAPDQEG